MATSKMLKIVGGLSAGLLASFVLKKISHLHTASQLIFDLVSVKIVGLDKLYLSLKVSNPNSDTITFDSINTELFFNKINIGRLYYNKPVLIAQNSSQTFVFPVILYPSGVLTVATNMLKTKAKEGIFTIDGRVFVNGVAVPITKTIKSW